MEAQFRIFRLPGLRRIESNFFKVQLSTFSMFDLYEVPIDIWRRYWTRRILLTKEALASLKSVVDMGDDPNYIPILQGSRM